MRSKNYIILIHALVWLTFLLAPLLFIDTEQGRERFILMGWFIQLLMAGYFYYNFLFLIPRFLLRKKILVYVGLLALGLIIISLLNVAFVLSTAGMIERHHPFNFWRAAFFPFYPAILAFALSSTVRITMEWFKTEHQKKEMEAEKLTSELAFLKSQINPHFLFNTLNNICSLARKKSDETENAIIKLSQIMRYMLQDSRDEKVNLEMEVEYLKSFIELQRIRLPESVNITFAVDGQPELINLEPLLLIPFVENAFKHGVTYQGDSDIIIHLKASEHSLFFCVTNKIVAPGNDEIEPGSGIGLKNVFRRLELLYPKRHTISVTNDGDHYFMELTINFSA
ncbi:MAG: histidine kinase [Bacteroidota bacterium]